MVAAERQSPLRSSGHFCLKPGSGRLRLFLLRVVPPKVELLEDAHRVWCSPGLCAQIEAFICTRLHGIKPQQALKSP